LSPYEIAAIRCAGLLERGAFFLEVPEFQTTS
jgi:hypothetical protein